MYNALSGRSEKIIKSDDIEVREVTDIWGEQGDIAAAAGGTGTIHAKLRRISTDTSALSDAENGFVVTASADNATAIASRAAEVGKSHYIAGVYASYGAAKTGLLQIKDGAAVVFEQYVYDKEVIVFTRPVKATLGNAVSAELAASGTAGVLGKVNLSGYTR